MTENISLSSSNSAPKPKTSSRDYFSEALTTAHQLRDTLEPVEVSSSFADRLREQLEANVDNAREMMVVREERRSKRQWMLAGTSGFVYLIALAYVSYKITKRISRRLFWWRKKEDANEIASETPDIAADLTIEDIATDS